MLTVIRPAYTAGLEHGACSCIISAGGNISAFAGQFRSSHNISSGEVQYSDGAPLDSCEGILTNGSWRTRCVAQLHEGRYVAQALASSGDNESLLVLHDKRGECRQHTVLVNSIPGVPPAIRIATVESMCFLRGVPADSHFLVLLCGLVDSSSILVSVDIDRMSAICVKRMPSSMKLTYLSTDGHSLLLVGGPPGYTRISEYASREFSECDIRLLTIKKESVVSLVDSVWSSTALILLLSTSEIVILDKSRDFSHVKTIATPHTFSCALGGDRILLGGDQCLVELSPVDWTTRVSSIEGVHVHQLLSMGLPDRFLAVVSSGSPTSVKHPLELMIGQDFDVCTSIPDYLASFPKSRILIIASASMRRSTVILTADGMVSVVACKDAGPVSSNPSGWPSSSGETETVHVCTHSLGRADPASLAMHPSGSQIAVMFADRVKIFFIANQASMADESTSSALVQSLDFPIKSPLSGVYSNRGDVLVIAAATSVLLIDPVRLVLIASIDVTARVSAVAVSMNDTIVLIATESGYVQGWTVSKDPTLVFNLQVGSASRFATVVAYDHIRETVTLLDNERCVNVVSIHNAAHRRELKASAVTSVVQSLSGGYVACGTASGRLQLFRWPAVEGRRPTFIDLFAPECEWSDVPIRPFVDICVHSGPITSLSITADERQIFTASTGAVIALELPDIVHPIRTNGESMLDLKVRVSYAGSAPPITAQLSGTQRKFTRAVETSAVNPDQFSQYATESVDALVRLNVDSARRMKSQVLENEYRIHEIETNWRNELKAANDKRESEIRAVVAENVRLAEEVKTLREDSIRTEARIKDTIEEEEIEIELRYEQCMHAPVSHVVFVL